MFGEYTVQVGIFDFDYKFGDCFVSYSLLCKSHKKYTSTVRYIVKEVYANTLLNEHWCWSGGEHDEIVAIASYSNNHLLLYVRVQVVWCIDVARKKSTYCSKIRI